MGDLAEFVSPIDGQVVRGRAAYREYTKRHNVTNVADYKETWEKAAKDRARLFTPGSKYDRERRIERIKEAIERNRK